MAAQRTYMSSFGGVVYSDTNRTYMSSSGEIISIQDLSSQTKSYALKKNNSGVGALVELKRNDNGSGIVPVLKYNDNGTGYTVNISGV